MRNSRAGRFSMLATMGLVWACGSGTPLVPTGPHPADAPPPVIVRDPPPATKVETVPLRRDPQCLWRGGYWQPRGGGWNWVKGAWVRPPDGCTLAPAVTRFEAIEGSTVLVHRAELWYRTAGKQSCGLPNDCSDL